jgi:hypothetical protein
VGAPGKAAPPKSAKNDGVAIGSAPKPVRLKGGGKRWEQWKARTKARTSSDPVVPAEVAQASPNTKAPPPAPAQPRHGGSYQDYLREKRLEVHLDIQSKGKGKSKNEVVHEGQGIGNPPDVAKGGGKGKAAEKGKHSKGKGRGDANDGKGSKGKGKKGKGKGHPLPKAQAPDRVVTAPSSDQAASKDDDEAPARKKRFKKKKKGGGTK